MYDIFDCGIYVYMFMYMIYMMNFENEFYVRLNSF